MCAGFFSLHELQCLDFKIEKRKWADNFFESSLRPMECVSKIFARNFNFCGFFRHFLKFWQKKSRPKNSAGFYSYFCPFFSSKCWPYFKKTSRLDFFLKLANYNSYKELTPPTFLLKKKKFFFKIFEKKKKSIFFILYMLLRWFRNYFSTNTKKNENSHYFS